MGVGGGRRGWCVGTRRHHGAVGWITFCLSLLVTEQAPITRAGLWQAQHPPLPMSYTKRVIWAEIYLSASSILFFFCLQKTKQKFRLMSFNIHHRALGQPCPVQVDSQRNKDKCSIWSLLWPWMTLVTSMPRKSGSVGQQTGFVFYANPWEIVIGRDTHGVLTKHLVPEK